MDLFIKYLVLILCIASLLCAKTSELVEFKPPIQSPEIALPVPTFEHPYKSPFLSVGLSYLFPGLGHLYLGDRSIAGRLMSSTCASVGIATFYKLDPSMFVTGAITLQTTWSYGVYAAYRDVRKYNGENLYKYKMPTEDFDDLTLAPFSFSILRKPAVWGGFLGAMTLATVTTYFAFPTDAHIQINASPRPMAISPLLALPVAIGEESFYRGYLQSELAESLTPWGGIALSSIAFGAAHIPNALMLPEEHRWRYYTFSLPLLTSFGAYFGWLTLKNQSLKESVALHTWYDFVLFSSSLLAKQTTGAAIGQPTSFTTSFCF